MLFKVLWHVAATTTSTFKVDGDLSLTSNPSKYNLFFCEVYIGVSRYDLPCLGLVWGWQGLYGCQNVVPKGIAWLVYHVYIRNLKPVLIVLQRVEREFLAHRAHYTGLIYTHPARWTMLTTLVVVCNQSWQRATSWPGLDVSLLGVSCWSVPLQMDQLEYLSQC